MSTRRNFLKSATGGAMVFCSCGLLDAAHAQGAGESLRRPVTVNGRRVRTVDVHQHCYFQDAIDLMGEEAKTVLPPVKGVAQHFIGDRGPVVAGRLVEMDEMGIDLAMLSINPFWYSKDRETAAKICEVQNTHFAELAAAYPDRFNAFGSLSLQFPDLAVTQLEDIVRKKGLKGAAIGGSVNGEAFSSPRFRPVLAKAEELGAVLFIHPQTQPELARRYAGNGWLSNQIGNPLDTTIALSKLIFDGTLDMFPRLKVLAAHGGGFLPSYAERMNHGCFVSPQNCKAETPLQKQPSEYLNQLYYDAMVFTPEGLRHLVAQVGASQIMLGTDHPIPWEQHPVQHVMATTTLSEAEKVAILGGNAARLLGLAA